MLGNTSQPVTTPPQHLEGSGEGRRGVCGRRCVGPSGVGRFGGGGPPRRAGGALQRPQPVFPSPSGWLSRPQQAPFTPLVLFITLGWAWLSLEGATTEGAFPEPCTLPLWSLRASHRPCPLLLPPSGGPGASGVELVSRPQEALSLCSLLQCRPALLSVKCVSSQKEP